MPQTRKRKVQKRNKSTESMKTITNSTVHKKRSENENCEISKIKVPRKESRIKQKIGDKNSKVESAEICKGKRIVKQECLLPRKEQKLQKVASPSMDLKNELNDSGNLHYSLNSFDSKLLSEANNDASKENAQEVHVKYEPSGLNNYVKDESSSSESEWEEVKDHLETNLDDYKPDIPEEGVEITIDCPELRIKKRKKKEFDENEWIRLHINRVRKDIQLSIHKTHLLCLLAQGMYVNKVLNSDTVKASALSLIPSDILSYTAGKKIDKIDLDGVEKIISWFRSTFTFETEKSLFLNIFSSIVKAFENQKSLNASEYNLMFIVIARLLGFRVRFCVSLYPLTYKASNLIKKPNNKRNSKVPIKKTKKDDQKLDSVESVHVEKKDESCMSTKHSKSKKELKIMKSKRGKKRDLENKGEENSEKTSRPKRSTKKNYKLSSDDDCDDSGDEDFEECGNLGSDEDVFKPLKLCRKSKDKTPKQKSNRKILSSDSEPSSPLQSSSALEEKSIVCWAEVFLKPNKQWISVECVNNIVNKPYDIEVLAPKPVSYILAYDNESYMKDVTRRYCNEYMTSTIKLRVDPDWWEDTLNPFLPPNSKQNKDEEKNLDELLINKPLPHTIQGFKNHPLYALKRHLLKFEAIYPPDAPPVGFIRGEPIYARECVCQLHSRETWLKEARVVRIGEEPYKIVKARPKWDRIAGVVRTDLPLEVFGFWQTEPYEPPVAVGGKVPRNEYGNVELFKPCMLPRGTVHLQLPGLNRIAKKLGIDCSPAVVGFDGHKGSVHPVFDGFVICQEYKEIILAAWDEEQENIRKREEEKREKRIYGNWKKLIKGLLIRERIKLKYDTK